MASMSTMYAYGRHIQVNYTYDKNKSLKKIIMQRTIEEDTGYQPLASVHMYAHMNIHISTHKHDKRKGVSV